jgi:hypothetical protein
MLAKQVFYAEHYNSQFEGKEIKAGGRPSGDSPFSGTLWYFKSEDYR